MNELITHWKGPNSESGSIGYYTLSEIVQENVYGPSVHFPYVDP